jgi:hypothetical protein
MTEQGFKATQPSGMVLYHSKDSVKSSMFGLKHFEYQTNKTKKEFFNELKLTSDVQSVSTTQNVILKTSLLYIKKEGWKVHDVQLKGD